MSLFTGFSHILIDVGIAMLPLIIAFLVFQLIMLRLPIKKVIRIIQGMILTYIGLALFLQGVNIGFMPIGQAMGESLAQKSYYWIVIPIGFILGFVSTLAEPAVRVLINEVEKVTGGHINKTLMLYSLCIGVALAVALSMLRIVVGISFMWFIAPLYLLALILMRFVSSEFVAVAFDSGGVATGPMTVTFILSLTMGIAGQLENRSVLTDGFGMVALVAIMPIITILILGLIYKSKERKNEY